MKEKKREKEELSFACFVGFKDSFFYRSFFTEVLKIVVSMELSSELASQVSLQ